MRVSTLLTAALLLVLGFAAPASAGLLELRNDPITLHWNCAITPCRHNNLAYQRVYVRDQYLRYDIHTVPARYEMRRLRVMVTPPTVVVYGRHRYGRSGLVALPVGAYRVVRPARYTWVTSPVLVSPARSYVTRRQPHTALYRQNIVVYQGSN